MEANIPAAWYYIFDQNMSRMREKLGDRKIFKNNRWQNQWKQLPTNSQGFSSGKALAKLSTSVQSYRRWCISWMFVFRKLTTKTCRYRWTQYLNTILLRKECQVVLYQAKRITTILLPKVSRIWSVKSAIFISTADTNNSLIVEDNTYKPRI